MSLGFTFSFENSSLLPQEWRAVWFGEIILCKTLDLRGGPFEHGGGAMLIFEKKCLLLKMQEIKSLLPECTKINYLLVKIFEKKMFDSDYGNRHIAYCRKAKWKFCALRAHFSLNISNWHNVYLYNLCTITEACHARRYRGFERTPLWWLVYHLIELHFLSILQVKDWKSDHY